MPKKTERGTLWDFLTSFLSPSVKKIKGGTLRGKKFFGEVSQSNNSHRKHECFANITYFARRCNEFHAGGGEGGDTKHFVAMAIKFVLFRPQGLLSQVGVGET